MSIKPLYRLTGNSESWASHWTAKSKPLSPKAVPVSVVKNALKGNQSFAPVPQPNPIDSLSLILPDLSAFDRPPRYQTTSRAIHSLKKTRGRAPSECPSTPPPRTTVTNPDTPEREIPSPLRDSVVLKRPHIYHNAETLQSPDKISSKFRKDVRKLEKRLNDKPMHSLIIGDSPLKNDVRKILEREIEPDRYGMFRVADSNGDPRVWGMHIHPHLSPSPSSPPTATLYPVKGKDIVPFTGSQLKDEWESYRKDKENLESPPSFSEHVKKHVRVENAQKVKKRKKSVDNEPVLGSRSLFSIFSPAPLSDIQPVEKDGNQGIDTPRKKLTGKQREIAHEEPLPLAKNDVSQSGQSSSSQTERQVPLHVFFPDDD